MGQQIQQNPLTGSAHSAAFRSVLAELSDYEPGKDIEELAEESGIPVDSIIKLASNECAFGPSPAGVAAIASEYPHLNQYPWKRFTDFKRLIAAFHGLDERNVVLGNGSESLISMVPQLYVDPGDEVVLATEGYPLHEQASVAMGAVVRHVPLRDFEYDMDDVLEAVTERTKVVWICSPNNPTGTIVRNREMRALLEGLPPTVAVVVDGAYREFVDDAEYADAVALVRGGWQNVIALRSLSKAYGLAGLRIGYLVASPEIANMLDRIREPFNMSRPATAAGSAAMRDGEWLRECQELTWAGRQYLTMELTRLGLNVVPSQANFVLVSVPTDARDIYHRLLKRGIIVRPTDGFGYPRHIRVTVGTDTQNAAFIAALEEVLADIGS